ncbi:MAG: hypothetical protein LBV51_01905 [Acholeplasmatales bacterium]|jgi:hypothetical protein|nr:hypothetical protein [Acholeplasmatales bacterium]
MFKKLLFIVLLFTFILPFVSCVKETAEPNDIKDIIETFKITEFIKFRENNMKGDAYLFMKEEDINDEIFVLPNHQDPSIFFEDSFLLYVEIMIPRSNTYKPISLTIVNEKLELLFLFLSDYKTTEYLHFEEFGIKVSKDFLKQKYDTITIKAIDVVTHEYGDSFIKAEGETFIIL